MLNHRGSVTIQTKRLILRKFCIDDSDAVFNNWANDVDVACHLTWRAHNNIKITQDVISLWCSHYTNKTYNYAIVIKGTNEPIGSIGIGKINEETCSGEFFYALSKKYWGNGIITEAMYTLLEYWFNEISFNRIYAIHAEKNPASGRVMQKLGMTNIGKICGENNDNIGNPIDVFQYVIDRKSFNAFKIRKAYSHEVNMVGELYAKLTDRLAANVVNYCGWTKHCYPTTMIADSGYAGGNLYVALIGSKIVGSFILDCIQPKAYGELKWNVKTDKALVIHTLAVNPDFLGQGVAQKLLLFAEDFARDNNICVIKLDTSRENIPAIKLYNKMGYLYIGNLDFGNERGESVCWYGFEKALI